jgi:hypothetical protein
MALPCWLGACGGMSAACACPLTPRPQVDRSHTSGLTTPQSDMPFGMAPRRHMTGSSMRTQHMRGSRELHELASIPGFEWVAQGAACSVACDC